MDTFNGFQPGERRVSKSRPKKADQGHSIIESSTTRQGSSFSFRYAVTCECGKRYTGRSYDTPFNTYTRHLRDLGVA